MPDTDQLITTIAYLLAKVSRYYPHANWQPGQTLKILFIGYNGKQNAGADLRVAAMARQFNQLLGQEKIEIGVLTLDEQGLADYFPDNVVLETVNSTAFWPIFRACCRYHMGVLAEGSCLKSKFSNALTTLFIGCAGIMAAQGKPCIAYGVEAGDLTPFMQRFTRKLCSQTHFLARSRPSLVKMRGWGLKAELGTDTAWDIEPASASWAKATLQKVAGWEGQRPLLAIAPINPFCWPVKASLKKYLCGRHKKKPASHYAGWYFFSESPSRSQRFQQYLSSITQAVRSLLSDTPIHPIIVGMDVLDQEACRRLQKMMPSGTVIFSSHQYDGYQLAALLRQATLLITSRYHARVLSMPAGVPAIAVSMDERLPNLLTDNSHLAAYCLAADDPLLADKLTAVLHQAWLDLPHLKAQTRQMTPHHLALLEDMGLAFRQLLQKEFPLFSYQPGEATSVSIPELNRVAQNGAQNKVTS